MKIRYNKKPDSVNNFLKKDFPSSVVGIDKTAESDKLQKVKFSDCHDFQI